jgi:hypothetical protein
MPREDALPGSTTREVFDVFQRERSNPRSSFHDRVKNARRATDLNRGQKDYEPE